MGIFTIMPCTKHYDYAARPTSSVITDSDERSANQLRNENERKTKSSPANLLMCRQTTYCANIVNLITVHTICRYSPAHPPFLFFTLFASNIIDMQSSMVAFSVRSRFFVLFRVRIDEPASRFQRTL